MSTTTNPLCCAQHWKLLSQTLLLHWPPFHLLDLSFMHYSLWRLQLAIKSWPANKKRTMSACYLIKKCVHYISFTALCAYQGPSGHATTVDGTLSFSGHSVIMHPCLVKVANQLSVFFFFLSDLILYLSGNCWCFVLLSLGNVAVEVVPQLLELCFLCLTF